MFFKVMSFFCVFVCLVAQSVFCETNPNQTDTISPILPPDSLPFKIEIEQADFSLPNGIHSGVFAVHDDKWLFLAGRTNGLHTFDDNNNNFPPKKQNTDVYVVDLKNKSVAVKSLYDPTSGLNQHQIDLLSVTSPQFYQRFGTLYITGGYGVDTATGQFSTKDALTAINISGLIHWVTSNKPGETAVQNIRQIHHPLVQVTGGYMATNSTHDITLLIFGQNFKGYYVPESTGEYTNEVRRFRIIDNGKDLLIQPLKAQKPDLNYHRRDLNVIPIIKKSYHSLVPAYVALSGVFTLKDGAWTIPVIIHSDGSSFTFDPADPKTFKQGMNNYVSAFVSLYSEKLQNSFLILLGGITYGFFGNDGFQTDNELPFTNQVTTVKIDKHDKFSQYIMENQYPVIISQYSNPGNPLLFGAGAEFIPASDVPTFNNSNDVMQYDKISDRRILVGYIVGGIQSTLPNTNTGSDSAASPFIFKLFLSPRK